MAQCREQAKTKKKANFLLPVCQCVLWIHNIKVVTCDTENAKCGRRQCKNVELLYAFEVELLPA